MTVLEFWPDYGPGPLWTADGKPADLNSLGLSDALVKRLSAWHAAYEEERVPVESAGDPAWLAQGAALLREVRSELGANYSVVVTEPWWGEEPS